MCTVIFLGGEGNSWIGCIQFEPICSLLAFVPFYSTFTTWRAVNVHVRQEISYTKEIVYPSGYLSNQDQNLLCKISGIDA